MRIADLKPGQKYFLPCVSCGDKKSVTFRDIWQHRRNANRVCLNCRNEEGGERLNGMKPFPKRY